MILKERPGWDQFFMLHAHLAATRSTCDRGPELLFRPERHGVGAVLVRDHRILAGGYNGSPPGQPHCDDVGHLLVDNHCRRTIHAEKNAILQCALEGISCSGAWLFTTAAPCYDCSKETVRAGIVEVVYGEEYAGRYGLSPEALQLLSEAGVIVRHLPISSLGCIEATKVYL